MTPRPYAFDALLKIPAATSLVPILRPAQSQKEQLLPTLLHSDLDSDI